MFQTNQSSSSGSSGSNVQEFSIRVPKNAKKKFNIMRFNSNLNVDFGQWNQVKMERENNKAEKHVTEEMPKYGAGSEYRREEKEEARRKRLGFSSRSYNPDDQPWILKCGGKNGKKFRGVREGGVGENAAYYVFTHGSDGSIEAYPVTEWYNFQPIQRYKALSAEEAELEFGKRNKSLNYFNLMMRKRFRKDEEEEVDEEVGSKKGKKKRDLKISEMDDWVDSEEDDDADSDDEAASENKESKKKKTKKPAPQKKKKANSDESALEESDDGDEEGRELDYISDSSDEVSDEETKIDKEMKGVSDESALRKLLTSDEEEEENPEEKKEENGNKSDQEEQPSKEEEPQSSSTVKKKRKKEVLTPGKSGSGDAPIKEDTSSEFSGADSSDSDADKIKTENTLDSQPNTSTESPGGSEPASKKPRLEPSSDLGISEEAVRRYLTRKPMTATELLQKFKKPRTNLNSEQLVNVMTQILKKINPIKQTIKNKMYLSLKPDNAKPK
ncbi:hypothetical protein V9T40_005324 [Parthenolecanium corni]|uniref:Transcription initiation factor IIF subunit alpha n=1 Tax=Parthenolecanium corni TaxID=536013 RepID=A0AAN9Y4E0_9HEMI